MAEGEQPQHRSGGPFWVLHLQHFDYLFCDCGGGRPRAITAGGIWLGKHPDKTFIGRIDTGFDFLGCHFGRRV
jgi:hypothetical protein